MKRRSFLGLLGGGAMAGPSAAKSALSSVTPTTLTGAMELGMPTSYGRVAQYGVGCKPFDRIADIRRRLMGEKTRSEQYEDDESRDIRSTMISLETSSLRSMAESAKFRRVRERQHRWQIERRRKWWEVELEDLLKQDTP